MQEFEWPALPAPQDWSEARHTLHMFAQMVGKVRMALAPPEPEWNHVALYVTARGLTTSPIPAPAKVFQCDFDFIDHTLRIAAGDGDVRTLDLTPLSVADFYHAFSAALEELDIAVTFSPFPSEVPNPVRFADDTSAGYDRDAVSRWWRALLCADAIFKEHRAPFKSRHTNVIFYWGSFDLSYSRYSGRPAPPPENADSITRTAMDAQEVSVGFWPGDDRFQAPAFYCYAYPNPAGFDAAKAGANGGSWNAKLGEFVLPYEAVRAAASPRAALLEFLQQTFDAGAKLGDWPA